MRARERGDGRVFQRGTVWWIAYYHRGKEIRESAKTLDERQGRKLLQRRLAEITTSTFIGPREERVTFEDLEAGYVQDYAVRKLRSADTAKRRVKNLRRFFGMDRALDITTARIRSYQESRLKEEAEGATINRETAALHRMFMLAIKGGLLSRCPVFPERVEENEARQGFLEHADYLAIRANLPADYQDVLDFGYFSGWRKREIHRLEWSHVDLDGNVILLDPAHSKNRQGRTLPIPPPLRDVLSRRLARRRLDTPRVFHVAGKPGGDWRKAWAHACIEAGFFRVVNAGTKDERKAPAKLFHDCRRTAVRNLDRARVPRTVAMKITGHKTEAIYRRYNIVDEADLRDAGLKLATYVASLPTKSTVVPLRPVAEAAAR